MVSGQTAQHNEKTRRPVEKESILDWLAKSGLMLVILDNDSANASGEKREFRLMPGIGMGTPSHLTFSGSDTLG